MKKEKLYEAIGEINENYICEAHGPQKESLVVHGSKFVLWLLVLL